jgi:hypothetical protein
MERFNSTLNQSGAASDTQGMSGRFMAIPLLAAVMALSSCSGDSGNSTATGPGEATEAGLDGPGEDVEVIRSWAEALTESDIEAAAGFFAVPSIAENGLTFEITTKDDALTFNESLPCGAELESTSAEGRFITATFLLTERPGAGPCPGSGNSAQTSFVIEDGAIAEWRRVALPGEDSSGQAA